MGQDELISVIVPVYNVERFIHDCMASLANQHDKNYEVVVIDDGSTDASIDAVHQYADKIDRLRIFNQPNRGLGASRNRGIDHAQGDFVVFVDSDDLVSEHYLESLRRVQRQGDYDIVTGGFSTVTESGDFLAHQIIRKAPQISPPITYYQQVLGAFAPSIACARLYRKRFLQKTGIRFPDRVPYEDLFFTYKLLRCCERHGFVNDYIYFWRQRQGSLSKSITRDHLGAAMLLWTATLRDLEETGSGPLDEALAARRNLTLFETIRRLTEKCDANVQDDFLNTMWANRDLIFEMYDKIKKSKISNTYVSPRLFEMLRHCKKLPNRSASLSDGNQLPDNRSQGALRALGAAANVVAETLPAGLKTGLAKGFPRLHQSFCALQGKYLESIVRSSPTKTASSVIDVAIFPLRGYHLQDCLSVVHRLNELGYSVEIVNTDSLRSVTEVTSLAIDRGINLLEFGDFISQERKVRCIVLFNDWDPLMRIVAHICFDNRITTVGWVEGIQDYLDADTGRLRHPYRRSLHVILPGRFDRRYFVGSAQVLHVGQVVRVQELWQRRRREGVAQEKKRVLINSNFSYGVLEDRRDTWLAGAVAACLETGFEPIISRHPFDRGTAHTEFETKATFIDALRVSTVGIHRFASGILESLAYGIPVIYYNPHGETVDKFAEPRGAYVIANRQQELLDILRARRFFWDESAAREFLELHAGLTADGCDSAIVMAQTLERIIKGAPPPSDALCKELARTGVLGVPDSVRRTAQKIGPIYGHQQNEKERIGEHAKAEDGLASVRTDLPEPAGCHGIRGVDMLGNFDREAHANIDETVLVSHLLGTSVSRVGQVMIDVGAHFGRTAEHFANKGMKVYCFEPDAANRKKLRTRFGGTPNVVIDARAVSERAEKEKPFFTSPESTGISALHAFRDTHAQTTLVDVTTVTDVVEQYKLDRIDFLKIDAEGFDFAVLRGVPWEHMKPAVIECEFEDAKTVPLGHTWKDVTDFLVAKGYVVYVSEWHPIVRYGIQHDWCRLFRYPGSLRDPQAWGNLLAFLEDPGIESMSDALNACIKVKGAQALPKNEAPRPAQTSGALTGNEGNASAVTCVTPAAVNIGESSRRFAFSSLLSLKLRFKRWSRVKYMECGSWVKARSPAVFRLGQLAIWSLSAAGRHPLALVTLLGALAALMTAPAYPPLWEYRIFFWSAAGVLSLLGCGVLGAAMANMVGRRLDDLQRAHAQTHLSALRRTSDGRMAVLESKIADLSKDLQAVAARQQHAEETSATLERRLGSLVEEVRAVQAQTTTLTGQIGFNATFQRFSRALQPSQIRTLRDVWSKRLGLCLTDPSLSYIAHRIRIIEQNATGRLATSIEDAVLRTLVSSSVKGDTLEVLEIGTLFGIGLAMIYDNNRGRYTRIHLTAIDPLVGYYRQNQPDPLLNIPISESIFWHNMERSGVPHDDVSLITELSTSNTTIEKVGKGCYDVLIIDGDHSYAGVKADFGHYVKCIRRDGYIIFDDYGATDWPDVKRFVDEEVLTDSRVTLVGSEWRTVVFRVVQKAGDTPVVKEV